MPAGDALDRSTAAPVRGELSAQPENQSPQREDIFARERARVAEKRKLLDALEIPLRAAGYDIGDFGQFLDWRDAKNGQGKKEKPDLLADIVSFRARQLAEIPERLWFIDGMITPGFNMVAAKKSQGKSFLLMQLLNAIAEGREFLGRKTTQAKVLYVSFELDEGDTSDRFKRMLPLSDNAYLLHTWSSGEAAMVDAERAIRDLGFGVLVFDNFLPMIPKDRDFEVNEYGDSDFYLKWRLLGKRNSAAIVASWHTGKTDREDFFLNPIGSAGMVAQADCLITIDRKRGHPEGKLFVGGNHAKDAVLPVVFEDGMFQLGEGTATLDRLTPEEERTLEVLAKHPGGCTPTAVGLALGKSDHAAHMALNRLIERGRVERLRRGIYGIVEVH